MRNQAFHTLLNATQEHSLHRNVSHASFLQVYNPSALHDAWNEMYCRHIRLLSIYNADMSHANTALAICAIQTCRLMRFDNWPSGTRRWHVWNANFRLCHKTVSSQVLSIYIVFMTMYMGHQLLLHQLLLLLLHRLSLKHIKPTCPNTNPTAKTKHYASHNQIATIKHLPLWCTYRLLDDDECFHLWMRSPTSLISTTGTFSLKMRKYHNTAQMCAEFGLWLLYMPWCNLLTRTPHNMLHKHMLGG